MFFFWSGQELMNGPVTHNIAPQNKVTQCLQTDTGAAVVRCSYFGLSETIHLYLTVCTHFLSLHIIAGEYVCSQKDSDDLEITLQRVMYV